MASICCGVKLELRHLQRWPEGARIAYLRATYPGRLCSTPSTNNSLRQRFAADPAQLGREVFRLLDAVDLMTTRTAVLHHQLLAVLDLRGVAGSRWTLATKSGSVFDSRKLANVATWLASKR